jgi:hypothetical protein
MKISYCSDSYHMLSDSYPLDLYCADINDNILVILLLVFVM